MQGLTSSRHWTQALLAREEQTAEKMKLKKSLQQKFELCEKGIAILVEKAECFESNNYERVDKGVGCITELV